MQRSRQVPLDPARDPGVEGLGVVEGIGRTPRWSANASRGRRYRAVVRAGSRPTAPGHYPCPTPSRTSSRRPADAQGHRSVPGLRHRATKRRGTAVISTTPRPRRRASSAPGQGRRGLAVGAGGAGAGPTKGTIPQPRSGCWIPRASQWASTATASPRGANVRAAPAPLLTGAPPHGGTESPPLNPGLVAGDRASSPAPPASTSPVGASWRPPAEDVLAPAAAGALRIFLGTAPRCLPWPKCIG